MGHGLMGVAARVLRSREDHAAAIAELRRLMREEPRAGSAEGERLELLAVLIQDYESRTFPIRGSTPQELVEFMADQRGLSRGDLATLLGGRSRLSDFMNGERALSLGQIARLHKDLGIPPGMLLETSETPASSTRAVREPSERRPTFTKHADSAHAVVGGKRPSRKSAGRSRKPPKG